ncbi:putative transcriptional regulator [Candidatus Methanoperedens nitroreducens]|uniref:Putative transcriptional regulator n=1 Tax=Candidatus Methanoperedens nitratireducens TaxID=1392998 RepID=A0A062VB94_9EURY|nr:metalloregulator ArsR/SmtB family transcription factor [Candidatus Methanoperedens nitroreducens]KCZ72934.1 putative transcriptional regulator [Candidatus Methanoperedens nitroreducens]MDJ1423138.1 metalloregulator ArsR/SmtB family transcription factor [Candidatus Methanoperedens sp.]
MLNGDLTTAKKYFFSALSDETRLLILYALKENGGMCVSDICKATGKDQSLISHHMSCLRNCGLVNTERNGKFVIYSIKNELISEILDLSDRHVKEMLEGILSCEVVNNKNRS